MRGSPNIHEVVVIGSGASGSWVAKELTERGVEVLMLEAGPPRIPTRDFTEHIWPYQLKFRGFNDQRQLLQDHPVQRLCYACDEYSHQFFVNDIENPYTFPLDKPFMWIRGRQVGGKTFCWARESYRFTDNEFKAASRDGYGEDWPISYKEIEPYYDLVESYIGVSGSREGLPQMPDGKFLPPMNMSCGGLEAKKILEQKFGWRVLPDRVANLTVDHRGRPACHYCDQCQRGCHTASYFNSPSVTLPAAARTGKFTLVSNAVVSDIIVDAGGRAKGVHYIDRDSREHREAYAKVVVVAAAALESTRILLNSKSTAHPQGIGNSNGVVGHYLMDHFTVEGANGLMPGFKSSKREPVGRPCGFLIPKYVNTVTSSAKDRNSKFLRGYRFDGDGSQELYGHAFLLPEFGDSWRKRVREEIPYGFGIEAQGECLPRYDNYVELDPHKRDAWGIPALHIHASYGENEKAMEAAMRRDVIAILDAMNLTDVTPPRNDISVFGKNIHECGTARMGSDPKKSVVDANCKVHDTPNVFVTDGAVFATQGCYEPTLTIMAISARAGEHIAKAFRQGEL
ncbi:MAG TPA: GMC family oxidoreductase [Candidatus Sulfotelmatobacter sp.]|nr:GMC family oxidoreductase [Candidatus Sulfotelmatobacter sp.]